MFRSLFDLLGNPPPKNQRFSVSLPGRAAWLFISSGLCKSAPAARICISASSCHFLTGWNGLLPFDYDIYLADRVGTYKLTS
jgi:hypothetical protein